MNVKSVSEKTGLTRRAIKYYEKEGLINPKKNEENNYREYTSEDITKLILIAALRMRDIPIPNIKEAIHGEKPLNIIMKKTLNDIDKSIQELQKNKSIINHLLDKSTGDINEMSSEVINTIKAEVESELGIEVDDYVMEVFFHYGLVMVWEM